MNRFYDFNKNEDKLEMMKKKFDRKCKRCGYTNRVLNKYKRELCKHCGYYVFLDEFDEFKFRLKEKTNRR